MSREAEKVRRSFENSLLVAPIVCYVDRLSRGGRKKFHALYDHARGVFKVPEEMRIEPGDMFILSDGTSFKVGMVQAIRVEGVTCYWEVTPPEPLPPGAPVGLPGIS